MAASLAVSAYYAVAVTGDVVVLLDHFIHSYSFNVQVDITQLKTDRQERKTELFIGLYVAVRSNYSNCYVQLFLHRRLWSRTKA